MLWINTGLSTDIVGKCVQMLKFMSEKQADELRMM
jgi:hypothetical protein